MPDIFNTGYTSIHVLNILIHVGFGATAIGLGLVQFFTRKGGSAHSWIGRTYLILFAVVIATAALGSFVFGFRGFLAALTLSAAYWLFSGTRVLALKDRSPTILDNAVALVFIAAAGALAAYQVYHPEQLTMPAFVALGNVTSICLYDLARNIGGAGWLRRSWLNEHIYKMIGSHGALISAAGGNMFVQLQPWSIFLPPLISLLLVVIFVLRHPLDSVPSAGI